MRAEELRTVWLYIAASGLTPRRFQKLLDDYGDVEGIDQAIKNGASMHPTARRMLLAARTPAAMDALQEAMYRHRIALVTRDDQGYPPLLRFLEDAPAALFVRGEAALSDARNFAIVGSRRCTRYGMEQAQRIAAGLAASGVTVVSGMARGIDTAAHSGCLSAKGRTVAVLGCGVDIAYPPENRALIDQALAQGGSVVSEYPPGALPLPGHFPVRNRILSGMSSGVLVVEATPTSGAMITVRHALAQGRDVYALPGPVDSPGSEMPLELLREGGLMATRAEDILESLRWLTGAAPTAVPAGESLQVFPVMSTLSAEEQRVVDCLRTGEQPFAELLARTGYTVPDLNSHLTMLELQEIIVQLPGRVYTMAR